MFDATLQYDVTEGGVATIALDQPDTRNAMSNALVDDLLAALEEARTDDSVRCVVIASTHEKTFSAGGDLAEFAAATPLIDKHNAIGRFAQLFPALGRLGKPSLCASDGHVLGGALGLALACDLGIASERATFGAPEITVGVFPFLVMAVASRNIPRKKCTELLLLGERIDAYEAERLGIVNRVVSAEDFSAAVEDWAGRLAAKSPVAMRLGKDAMFRQEDLALVDALELMQHYLTLTSGSEDLQEGVRAFFEKRAPHWMGR